MFRKTRHIHFIGIGGIGMSGMAELLQKLGFDISGSDSALTERTKQLSELGIQVYSAHDGSNVLKSDVVVYSSAIPKYNPEIVEAIKQNIPVIRRAEMLGELLKVKPTSIAIAGTHGKTSTASILGAILIEANLDPTLVIGGIVNKFQTNAISGDGDVIVVEADEFDRSFLALQPTMCVVTNLDLEHLDCYENLEDLSNAFAQFCNATPFYGIISLCVDSDNLTKIVPLIKRPIVTFGFSENADYQSKNVSYKSMGSEFDVIAFDEYLGRVKLNIPGKHNIQNTLGAISMALELDIPFAKIIDGISSYTGVRRRFEIKYLTKNNILIIDDYAHHPTEVSATLQAANSGWDRRIISIFQPHLFSRTRDFHMEFSKAFLDTDILIITDIYPAREAPIEGISSQLIVDDIRLLGYNNVYYVSDVNDIPALVKSIAKKSDMIITMGAGHIWRQCESIAQVLDT
jgi:UDP-N-acetylmuramate--alanine ligase